MPPASCGNPIRFNLNKDNGLVQFLVELTWDGTSTPTTGIGCNGVVSRVFFKNNGQKTWYGHLPATKFGPAVYQIVPGDTRDETNRTVLHALGLDDRSDVSGAEGIDLNEVPPQPGETLLNP